MVQPFGCSRTIKIAHGLTGLGWKTSLIQQGARLPTWGFETFDLIMSMGEESCKTCWATCLKALTDNLDRFDVVHCYDEKTEVLTSNGWKLMSDATYDDNICTLNPKNNHIEYQHPTDIIRKEYEGKMYHFSSPRIADLMVTPNHKLYTRIVTSHDKKYDHSKFELLTAQDVFGKQKAFDKSGIWIGKTPEYFILPEYKSSGSNYVYKNRKWPNIKIPIESWIRFLGWYLSEGSLNKSHENYASINIVQKDESNIDEICSTIKDMGFNYSVDRSRCPVIRINSVQLASYLKNFGLHAWEKRVPRFVMTLNSDLINIFLGSYHKGDGTHRYDSNSIASTSIGMMDDLQELLLKSGSCGNVYLKCTNDTMVSPGTGKVYNCKPCYNITLYKHTKPVTDKRTKSMIEEWVDYDGMIYCVTVPNHIVYVRRNGKAVWCGNSSNTPDGYSLFLVTESKTPVIHDCHDAMSSFTHIDTSQAGKTEMIVGQRADGVMFVSEGQRDFICDSHNIDKSKTYIYPNYCLGSYISNYPKPKKSDVSGDIHLVYEGGMRVGGMEGGAWSAHRDLWKLFKMLLKQGIHIHIYSAVEYDPNKGHFLPIDSPLLHWHPPTSLSTLMREMTQYDAGIVAFDRTYEEFIDHALPNKMFEYMGAGLPVLCDDAKDVADWLEKYDVGEPCLSRWHEGELDKITFKNIDPHMDNVDKHRMEWTVENNIAGVEKFYERVARRGR